MDLRYRNIFFGLSILIFASTASSDDKKPYRPADQSVTSLATVFEIVDPGGTFSSLGDEIDATTMLVRRRDGIGMSFNTTQLLPDAPYTAWWVIFNKPNKCLNPCECGFDDVFDLVHSTNAQTSVFFATGRMTDSNGQAVFSAQIERNELPTGDDQVLFGPGLTNPDAEVHLVTRTHGLALGSRDELDEQLTQFNGGCNVDCFDTHVSVHRSPSCEVKRTRGYSFLENSDNN